MFARFGWALGTEPRLNEGLDEDCEENYETLKQSHWIRAGFGRFETCLIHFRSRGIVVYVRKLKLVGGFAAPQLLEVYKGFGCLHEAASIAALITVEFVEKVVVSVAQGLEGVRPKKT